jgi:hypothetical protein
MDDAMHPDEHPEPDPAEAEAGRAALRALGDPGPVPGDVLARLEGRLEGELGLGAPVRRARPRRRLRLALPAVGAALAIAVATVAVISTHGSSNGPSPTAFSAKTAQDSTERSAAPSASKAAGIAAPKATVAPMVVPDMVGKTVAEARRLLGSRGFLVTPGCPATERVTAQRPKAGTHVARGARVELDTRGCGGLSGP